MKFSEYEKSVVKEMIEDLLVRNPEYRGVYEEVLIENKIKDVWNKKLET